MLSVITLRIDSFRPGEEKSVQNTRRQRRRDETQDEIVSLAWEQLAQGGTEALSLRGISREMRMSSSALFRYFPNREALLEELNRQAYHEQNRCMLEAVEILPQEAHVARLQAASLAYRAWALLNPHKFVLIYGSPLRGFDPLAASSSRKHSAAWSDCRFAGACFRSGGA